jgi:DNA-binding Lrp family transcriptional regulator
LRVHDVLARDVVTSSADAARDLPLSEPTVATALRHLEELGVVREMTGRSRSRIWGYTQHLSILNEGTEPIVGHMNTAAGGAAPYDASVATSSVRA